mmetsp:Transcript_49394/g.107833  ORF Transcript_49394/g.107833 Transcript_49394/m.107833 type:complete len:377 (+) Transcript_49394:347-1477(+)
MEVLHVISSHNKGHGDVEVACSPVLLGAQLFLDLRRVQIRRDVVKIIAEVPLARRPHIVGVQPLRPVRGDHPVGAYVVRHQARLAAPHAVVARPNGRGAGQDAVLHVLVHLGILRGHALLEGSAPGPAPVQDELGVVLVLLLGVDHAVTDAHTVQWDVDALFIKIPLGNTVPDCRNVVPGVGLPEDVERHLLVLGKLLKEPLKKGVPPLSHPVLILGTKPSGESHTCGLIQEQQVSPLIPREIIHHCLPALVHKTRPVLLKQRQLGGAPRPTRQPDHQWVGARGVTALEEPEEVFGAGGSTEVPSGLIHLGVANLRVGKLGVVIEVRRHLRLRGALHHHLRHKILHFLPGGEVHLAGDAACQQRTQESPHCSRRPP